ncbi:MAG: flagellar motor switch protein FliN [Fimbriimonadaceae bacterium]|nr:flagellar motor switch protein FliN [Fimbriimonadaceae bacterium]
MPIPADIITKLTNIQNQVWQTVSLTVSEQAGAAINFGSPLTTPTSTADLYAEMAAPKLIIQFAFASLPENSMVVLLPQDAFADLVRATKGGPIESVDENAITEIRPLLEGIVQGLCLSIGNIRNEAIVASGLSIRFQIFSFPPNLQKADELIRTSVAVTGDDLNGTAMWLMDNETAHAILGLEVTDDDSRIATDRVSGAAGPSGAPVDDHGLEILLDIPLEISVELGRVRMLVKDVVELGAGSIVEIEKAAGEPVDVMVNGRLVARGEVVVIEDNFGVRITEILSPQERLQKLNEVA